jgi:hypothetical protein
MENTIPSGLRQAERTEEIPWLFILFFPVKFGVLHGPIMRRQLLVLRTSNPALLADVPEFGEIGHRQPLVSDGRMGLASVFQEFPQFLNISLRLVKLRVILDHGVTYSKMMLAKVTADPVLGVNPAGLLFYSCPRRL